MACSVRESMLVLLPELEEALHSIYANSSPAMSDIAYGILRMRGMETGKDITFAELEGDMISFITQRGAESKEPMAMKLAAGGRVTRELSNILAAMPNRSKMSIGKFARAIAGDIPDRDLEAFVNTLRAKSADREGYSIEVVEGDAIKKMYSTEAMVDCAGSSLFQSCMKDKHKVAPNVFDIYTKNPDVCKAVAMFDKEGKLAARALLWKVQGLAEGMPKDFWFVDRIYSARDWMASKIKDWANAKGYGIRTSVGMLSCSIGGKEFKCEMRVAVKKVAYRGFPYMDTFCYYDVKNGWLYSYDAPGFEGLSLQSTSGQYGLATGNLPVFRNYIRRFTER